MTEPPSRVISAVLSDGADAEYEARPAPPGRLDAKRAAEALSELVGREQPQPAVVCGARRHAALEDDVAQRFRYAGTTIRDREIETVAGEVRRDVDGPVLAMGCRVVDEILDNLEEAVSVGLDDHASGDGESNIDSFASHADHKWSQHLAQRNWFEIDQLGAFEPTAQPRQLGARTRPVRTRSLKRSPAR